MTTALTVLKLVALALVCAILGGVIYIGRRDFPLIHATIWNISSASWKVNMAADKEIEHFTNELKETQKATSAVKDFFDHSDLSVNGKHHDGLIPQATALIVKAQPLMDHLNDAALHLDSAIKSMNELILSSTATVGQLQLAIAQVVELTQALQTQVSDPDIKVLLANLLEAAKSAAIGMEQLAAGVTDLRQIADKARETYLKPVNLWWAVVKQLLSSAGSAAQVVK